MEKDVRVVLADSKLKKRLGKIREKELRQWLNRAFDQLKENPSQGTRIPKKQIPREYVKEYGVNNLWKYNLPEGRRLLYSLSRMGPLTVVVVMDWMKHKEYERKFSY